MEHSVYPTGIITADTTELLSTLVATNPISRNTATKIIGFIFSKIGVKILLKNAIIPVITYAGPLLATLLTGSFVVESMFSIPGIGAEFVGSVSNRDYTLIMALTIFYGGMVIVANIITDVISAMIDPRIRLK